MRLYIRTAVERPGEQPVVWAARNHQADAFDTDTLAAHTVQQIDEEVSANVQVCGALEAAAGRTDFRGLHRFYVSAGKLWRRGGWRPGIKPYTPSADVEITIAENLDKKALRAQLAAAVTRLQTIQANVQGSTLAQTQTAVKDMALYLEVAIKRLAQVE